MTEPLDNVVWHALNGPHRHFAEGDGLVKRYPLDVAYFYGLPDTVGPAAWEAARALSGASGVVTLFRDEVTPPDGWQVLMDLPTVQMVLKRPSARPGPTEMRAVELGDGDV